LLPDDWITVIAATRTGHAGAGRSWLRMRTSMSRRAGDGFRRLLAQGLELARIEPARTESR
jgi:hypothetical protein